MRQVQVFLLLCFLLAASLAQASGDFYTINCNNIGKISTDGTISKCGNIALSYAISMFTYNTSDGCFYTIDNGALAKLSFNGLMTEISRIQVPPDYGPFLDITYNTSDGNFYSLNMNHLVRISPTGNMTEVCDLGYPFMDYGNFERICYNTADGNFYATNCNHLVKITPGGNVTEICDLGVPYYDYDTFRSLCYNASDDCLYTINNNHLARISTSGVVTEVSEIRVTGIDFDRLTNITWVPTQSVLPPPVSIGKTKSMRANTSVVIEDAVVTAVNIAPGAVYVEASNRTSGIKLLTTQQLSIGQRVKFSGVIQSADGEYQINATDFRDNDPGNPLEPLLVCSKIFERTFVNRRKEISISGLLVRYAGKVTSTNTSQRIAYVDDGGNFSDRTAAGVSGVRVRIPASAAMPLVGDTIAVTGISRTEKAALPAGGSIIDGKYYAAGTTVYISTLWPRDSADILLIKR